MDPVLLEKLLNFIGQENAVVLCKTKGESVLNPRIIPVLKEACRNIAFEMSLISASPSDEVEMHILASVVDKYNLFDLDSHNILINNEGPRASASSASSASDGALHPSSQHLRNIVQDEETRDFIAAIKLNDTKTVTRMSQERMNVPLDNAGNFALHLAARFKNLNMVKLFLESPHPLDINAQNNAGSTALHLVINLISGEAPDISQQYQMVECLLQHQASVYTQDDNGRTALHFAVGFQNISLAQLLLASDKGIVDFRDNYGETALHLAVKAGNSPLVELLLSKGANPMIPNNKRLTPIECADFLSEEDGFIEIQVALAKYLLQDASVSAALPALTMSASAASASASASASAAAPANPELGKAPDTKGLLINSLFSSALTPASNPGPASDPAPSSLHP